MQPKPVWPRVAWTLLAVALLVLFGHILLPGVDRAELHFVARGAPNIDAQFSVIALGLNPLVDAFLLVELVALIVPRWRRLRHGGPEGRRALDRAVAAAAIVFAAIQAHLVVRYLESRQDIAGEIYVAGPRQHWLLVLTLIAGVPVLAWLISIIHRRGVGNGYAVLIVASWLAGAPWHEAVVAGYGGLILGAAAAGIIVLGAFAFDARTGELPLPASGLSPISTSAGILAALSLLATLRVLVPPRAYEVIRVLDTNLVVAPALVGVLALAWAWVFARPRLWRDQLVRAGLPPVDRGTWLGAAVTSALVLVAAVVLSLVGIRHAPKAAALVQTWMLLFLTATLLDLRDELTAQRRGLVGVWPLHSPVLATAAAAKLTAAGIDHHLNSRRTRALLWFFGPYVPIVVLVPADRAPDAERVLRELVG